MTGRWPTQVLGLLGIAGVAVGLAVAPASIGFDMGGALRGVASLAPATAGAAVVTVAASLANLVAGAVVVRLISRRAFASIAGTLLAGFAGAVLLDVLLLYLLGGIGLFTRPVLLVVHVGVVGGAWLTRLPLLRGARVRRPRLTMLGAFIIVAWSAPVVLQLASPVVPFIDVLPNHVAPVEHVRTFASFDPLTTAPSPVYGPSRTSLGYVGVLGAVAVMTDLDAAQAVSAFIVVEVVLVAVAVHRLATTVGGPSAGTWMLVTFALTQAFARLADDRARILALPLALWTLAEFIRATRRPGDRRGVGDLPAPRRVVPIIGGLAATLLMHAVIGSFTAATVLVLALLVPGARRLGVTTVPVAAALALPQALTMAGVALPPATGLLSLPTAAVVLVGVRHAIVQRSLLVGGTSVVVIAAAAGMWQASALVEGAVSWAADFVPSVPVLLTMAVVAGFVARRRMASPVVWAPLLIGAAAGSVSLAIPPDSPSLLLQSVRFEIPKEVHTWAPTFLALGAAIGIAELLLAVGRPPRPGAPLPWQPMSKLAFVGAFVLAAALPLRVEPIGPFSVGEHRVSENLAIHLRHAEHGFWVGFPDARFVVDAEQRGLLDAVRNEIAAGSIDGATQLLHVAASYQHSASTPVGVFTGVRETTVSTDASVTIHTVGGRLRPVGDLSLLLDSREPGFSHVLLEPDGLPPGARQQIADAGYRSVYRNERGELFVRRDG